MPSHAVRGEFSAPHGTQGGFAPLRSQSTLLALLLVVLTVLAYRPVAQNAFLSLDDTDYITANAQVKSGLSGQTVRWAFTTFAASNYHPLTWLSHALDCQLFGMNPAAHHAMNVLLHAVNAVLLFLLLQSATGSRWRSWLVAALFAVHPLNVESVAWAAERKNVLSMLFLLLAMLAYVQYARRLKPGWYVLTAALFTLGLLAKPQIITFPCLLFLMDAWPLNRICGWGAAQNTRSFPQLSPARILLEKVPLLVLSAASAVVTIKAQAAGHAVQSLSSFGLGLRVETALVAYARYLGKAFWPVHLAGFYPHPSGLYPLWQVIVAALVLVLCTALCLVARRRYLLVGWLWFLGALFPMIGLVQVGMQAMADRYAYLSFIGLFIAGTWLVGDALQPRLAAMAPSRMRTALPALLAFVVLSAAGIATCRQVSTWHDSETFWKHTLAVTSDNFVAHDGLARVLMSEGRADEAAIHYRAALAIHPTDLTARLGLGVIAHAHGDLQSAVRAYSFVIQHAETPDVRAEAFAGLGSAYRQLGELDQARQCFEVSLELMPNQPRPLFGLGLIAHQTGHIDAAIPLYERALKLEPSYAGFLVLAQALEQQGKTADAAAFRERVAKVCPDLPAATRQAEDLLAGKFTITR